MRSQRSNSIRPIWAAVLGLLVLLVLALISVRHALESIDFGAPQGEAALFTVEPPHDAHSRARAAFAEDNITPEAGVVCKSFGNWRGRTVSECHVAGGGVGGCYETTTGVNVTAAIRKELGEASC